MGNDEVRQSRFAREIALYSSIFFSLISLSLCLSVSLKTCDFPKFRSQREQSAFRWKRRLFFVPFLWSRALKSRERTTLIFTAFFCEKRDVRKMYKFCLAVTSLTHSSALSLSSCCYFTTRQNKSTLMSSPMILLLPRVIRNISPVHRNITRLLPARRF